MSILLQLCKLQSRFAICIAIECKVSKAPALGRGFWNALRDLEIKEAWIIAPVAEPYGIGKGVQVSPLAHFLSS
jgi:hypothetical protein